MRSFSAGDGEGGANASHWYPGEGILHVRLPNFAWRRRAIARHDIHHLLTGYPHTRAGEMQMAAWEFAAGRFPHPAATAFCLPLVAMGAIAFPRRTYDAFVRGRRSTSLYQTELTDDLLDSPAADLQSRFAPGSPAASTIRDKIAYAGLVGLSLAMLAAPFLLLGLAVALAFLATRVI